MARLRNSIIDFTNRINDTVSLEDYFTFDLKAILNHIDTYSDDFFDWYQIADDDKLERIALELYGNPDYWDILLLINGKDALFDMPYSFDTISKLAEELASDYANSISSLLTLPDSHVAYLQSVYEEKYRKENESNRLLRIIKPTRMQEFIQIAYTNGYFV